MFCNKCGSQVPDGMNFCNNCGSPITPAAPQAPVQPPVAPMQQSEPPKKKKTGLIIGIVAGILAIAIAVFCITAFVAPGFLLKDKKDDDKDEKKDSTTTSAVAESTTNNGSANNQTPEVPVETDLVEAKSFALEYIRYVVSADVKSAISYEGLDWNNYCAAMETSLFEYYKESFGNDAKLEDMYKTLSENSGYIIMDIDSLFASVKSRGDGAGDPDAVTITSCKKITSEEASSYNKATSNHAKECEPYGLEYSYDYLSVQTYVQVEATVPSSEQDSEIFVILGYDGNDWTVLYMEADGEPGCLFSLGFIS